MKERYNLPGHFVILKFGNNETSITCDGELVLLKENWESVSSVSGRSESKQDDTRPLL